MDGSASTKISPLDDLWSRIHTYLRSRLRHEPYERWFAPLHAVSLDGGRLLRAGLWRLTGSYTAATSRERTIPTRFGAIIMRIPGCGAASAGTRPRWR